MAFPRRNISDNIESSDQDEMNSEELSVQKFCKSMLQGRIFIGSFLEKRYVENLKAYRDVISIDSNEKDLQQDLNVVNKKLRRFTSRWVGITTPDIIGAPIGFCLWVENMENANFENSWFKITRIKFKTNEIIFRIKQLRIANNDNSRSSTSLSNTSTSPENKSIQVYEIYNNIKLSFLENIKYFWANILTIKNTKDAILFIGVLFMTVFTGAIQLFQYIGDFSLKLLRELSFLIRSLTPVLIACINMVGKCVMGLYMLVHMLFKGNPQPKNVYITNEIDYPSLVNGRGSFANRRGLPPSQFADRRGLPPPRFI